MQNSQYYDVGIDFGTTNTVITYFAAEAGPQPYVDLEGDVRGVHPTVIHQSRFERLVGWAATIWRGQNNTAEHFKLALSRSGANADERARSKAFRDTRDFLGALTEAFRKEMQGDIGRLCLTAPEAWLSGLDQAGASALREIAAELSLPAPILVSEPFAAACNFADQHKRKTGAPFHGYVFVYDHGGGTCDLAMVRIAGGVITRLAGEGFALDLSPEGFGGVAYDLQVLRHLESKYPALARYDVSERAKWVAEFETHKRRAAPLVRRALDREQFDQELFPVRGAAVTLGDLKHVFDSRFERELTPRVERFLAQCQKIDANIDYTDPTHFRVVTVGGFSEFALTQDCLTRIISRVSKGRRVMDEVLAPGERWLTVSKGACLIASRAASINLTSPYTFGVIYFDEGGDKPRPHPMIVEGADLKEYQQARMVGRTFALQSERSDSHRLTFYIERAGAIVELRHERPLVETLPDATTARDWSFGCSIADGVIHVEIRSDRGGVKTIPMGDFITLLRRVEPRR